MMRAWRAAGMKRMRARVKRRRRMRKRRRTCLMRSGACVTTRMVGAGASARRTADADKGWVHRGMKSMPHVGEHGTAHLGEQTHHRHAARGLR